MTLTDRFAQMSSTQHNTSTMARPAAELQTMTAVSVHQLMDAVSHTTDDVYRVNDSPLVQLTIVGKAINVSSTPGLLEFELDDSTGAITVKQYYNKDESTSSEAPYTPKEAEYVRVYGMLRPLSDGVSIIAVRVAALRNPNELSYHILEVIMTHCHHKKGPLPSLAPPPSQNAPSPNAAGVYYPGFNSPSRSAQAQQTQSTTQQQNSVAQRIDFDAAVRSVEDEIIRVCKEYQTRNSYPTKDEFTSYIKHPAPVIMKTLAEMRTDGRLFLVKKDQYGLAEA